MLYRKGYSKSRKSQAVKRSNKKFSKVKVPLEFSEIDISPTSSFKIEGKYLYYIRREKNKDGEFIIKDRELVGAAPKIICEIERESGEVSFVVMVGRKKFSIDHIEDIETIIKLSGVPCLNRSKLKKFLIYQRMFMERELGELPHFFLIERTFFDEEEFLYFHPSIEYENVIYDIKTEFARDLRLEIEKEKREKNLEFLREILKEGKIAGLCALASISAVFPDLQSYTVSITGLRGKGKTTLARGVCRFWADIKREINLNATQTGLELSLNKLNNMALLFDECSLSYDEKIEKMVYMVASGKGRTRGTRKLEVKTTDIRNVVFITGEKKIEGQNLGMYRRVMFIPFSEWSDATNMKIEEFIEKSMASCGAGIEIAMFLMEKGRDYLDALTAKARNSMLMWEREMWRALFLVEDFFQEEFTELRKSLQRLIDEHLSEVDRDVWQMIEDSFREFAFENKSSFEEESYKEKLGKFMWTGDFDEVTQEKLKNKFGVNCKFLLLTSQGLKKFQAYSGVDRDTIIREARKREFLISNERGRNTYRAGNGQRFYFIAIPLDSSVSNVVDINYYDWSNDKHREILEKIEELLAENAKDTIIITSRNWMETKTLKDFLKENLNDFDVDTQLALVDYILCEAVKKVKNREVDITQFYEQKEAIKMW